MFVTNWISTTKIQKISEITNFFRHYFLSRTEVIDEKHRLRTGEGGDVRIVEILAKTRNAIRKTAILLSSESPGKLSVRSNHPTDRSTRLDSIR